MEILTKLLEDVNAIIWRYSIFGIRKCETPGCTKNAMSGKKMCMQCLKFNAEIQQMELFKEILKSLERIETTLSSNSLALRPERIEKINNNLKEQQDVFIPSIEIPETNIQALNEKKTTIIKNVSELAKQLNNVDKEG